MSTISVFQLSPVSSISLLFFPFLLSLHFHIFTPYPIMVHTSSINKPHFSLSVSVKPFSFSNSLHLPHYNRSLLNALSNLCLCSPFLCITYFIIIYINFFIFFYFHLLSLLANFSTSNTSKIKFCFIRVHLKTVLSKYLSIIFFIFSLLFANSIMLYAFDKVYIVLSLYCIPSHLTLCSFISAINKLKSMGLKK